MHFPFPFAALGPPSSIWTFPFFLWIFSLLFLCVFCFFYVLLLFFFCSVFVVPPFCVLFLCLFSLLFLYFLSVSSLCFLLCRPPPQLTPLPASDAGAAPAKVPTPSLRVEPARGDFNDVERSTKYVLPFTIHNTSSKVCLATFSGAEVPHIWGVCPVFYFVMNSLNGEQVPPPKGGG